MEKFVPPVRLAEQHLRNVVTNGRTFLARDFHMKSGMKYLFEAFYRAIARDTPVPIPYREILVTAHIMDAIFGQLGTSTRSCAPARTVSGSVSDNGRRE